MAKQSWSDIKKQLHEMDSADSAKRIQSRTNTAIRQQAAAYRPTPAETAAYQPAPANGRNDEDTSSVAARSQRKRSRSALVSSSHDLTVLRHAMLKIM